MVFTKIKIFKTYIYKTRTILANEYSSVLNITQTIVHNFNLFIRDSRITNLLFKLKILYHENFKIYFLLVIYFNVDELLHKRRIR